MDVGVLDIEGVDMGHCAVADDADTGPNEVKETHTEETSTVQDRYVSAKPHAAMEFDSEGAAKAFYDDYTGHVGFSTKVGQYSHHNSDGKNTAREFVSVRETLKRRNPDSSNLLPKIGLGDKGKWSVTKFVKEHNYSTVSPSKVQYLRSRRHFAGVGKNIDETCQGAVPSGFMYVSMDGNHVSVDGSHGARNASVESNCRSKNTSSVNYVSRCSHRRRLLKIDSQNLLDYLMKMQGENPGFFYAIQLDEDSCMGNVFWADARSRTAYSHFGDAVTLDTTFRVNQYIVPFVAFTGVNHHGQTILFGCALLLDDSEASFIWLFKTFLLAMNGRSPVSMTTDQDRTIQTAVSLALPEACHCISKWHVLREGQERLAPLCHAHPNFQLELYNCINLTETIEEFESSWNSIIDKYDLWRNEWLQSLYNSRSQWVPVYFRGSFFAAISTNQGIEGSFFDGYITMQTTLPMFFRQYERALEHWFEKEIEADFDTHCTIPILKTPSPMEKQAANLYTRKIFAKFQEELVETFVYTANRIEGDADISTFRVAKFEDDHKAYIVELNIPEMRASCSCQMFEFSGILCRHVLTVFTVTNVLTLPYHYILKRWTRNAKSNTGSEDHAGELPNQDSLTMRYNYLCQEAIKFAEEGAIAVGTYSVALGVVREGWKKLAMVKKTVAKLPPSPQFSGVGYDEKKPSGSSLDMVPSLWPRQDEVTRHFNLNDDGIPAHSVADLNFPRLAPVSLHRDDGHLENMVILPCLKSMTWVMVNKNSTPMNRVAVINLKLQDNRKTPSEESEVKFQLSRVTLEPMLRSMAYISEQLSAPANRVAVINLKLQDGETTSGDSEVKFQVSRDTLGAMLRSMAYISEQLSNGAEPQLDPTPKRQRN